MNCTECKNTVKRIDDSSEFLLCTKCGCLFDPAMKLLVNIGKEQPADSRAKMPEVEIKLNDVVLDFHTDEATGKTTFTSRAYLPKDTVAQDPFDPTDNTFQFYMKVHRKRFKNRRRYRYELERRIANTPL